MTKKKEKSLKKRLYNKCWKLMSLYSRLKFADNNGYVSCITCGQVKHYKEMNAGHLKHGVLDYDHFNIAPQCVGCNKWNSGRLDRYSEWLIKTYGLAEFENLCQRASMAKKGEPYSTEDLEKIAIDLTLKIAELNLTNEGI